MKVFYLHCGTERTREFTGAETLVILRDAKKIRVRADDLRVGDWIPIPGEDNGRGKLIRVEK